MNVPRKAIKAILAGSLACGLGLCTPLASAAVDITGAGSTFVYPVMSKWAASYHSKTNTRVNYLSVGSGGGIAQIKAGKVTFGASDMPLKPEELQASGLAQFPLVVGGVVPVVNIEGVKPGQMKFTGVLLADIYLGKVKKWNDPAIASLNPDLKLPDQNITVVHRVDPSGTTFNWVNYLSKVSEEWKSKIGEGASVAWPTGVAGKGNDGVAMQVNYIKGAIGYVELSYATQKQMSFAQLKNKAGQFVVPSMESFQAAASSADWTKQPDFYQVITDAPGKEAWPIAATVFVLMHKQPKDPTQAAGALEFFRWALQQGQADAKGLAYVPLPESLVQLIQGYWAQNVRAK